MNFRYKCYYDHEHCLENISPNTRLYNVRPGL
ncbi:hypothetical protein T01_11649 [Trichinella spiralis]|uniref:Uncharacterized protein n=1 Tax=Trichinella spiralis TaxID=6334 RepID=A0A0V1AKH3_TRISP|nr:hypothetical protein T01_11649 [Trichinella spiralis]